MYLCCVEKLSRFQSNFYFYELLMLLNNFDKSPCCCLAHLACFVVNPSCFMTVELSYFIKASHVSV